MEHPRPKSMRCAATAPASCSTPIPLAGAREAVDAIVTVTEAEIVTALGLLLTRAKLVAEGSGAAATAAVLSGRSGLTPGSRVCAIVSGGNIDVGRLCAAVAAGGEA